MGYDVATEIEAAGKSAATYAREAVQEVDPDGGGFHIREAVGIMVQAVLRDGLLTPHGEATPAVMHLLRCGAGEYVRQHRPTRQTGYVEPVPPPVPARALSAVEQTLVSGQTDMAEISEDFVWMFGYTALDDSREATRKQYLHLNYDETVAVVSLKRKKASQTLVLANLLDEVLRRHPDWKYTPHLALADVIDQAG